MLHLSRNGWVPNNEILPVLLYRSAIEPGKDHRGSKFSERFRANSWPAQWRHSVYDFHHYHSTTHEVMGFAIGQARLVTAELPGLPVWAIDADALIVRPGPRVVDGVEALAAILHPGAVPAPLPHTVHRVSPGA